MAAARPDLGNELVRLDPQIEDIPGPHLLAPMEPRPHRVELNADAFFTFLRCQQALVYLESHITRSTKHVLMYIQQPWRGHHLTCLALHEVLMHSRSTLACDSDNA